MSSVASRNKHKMVLYFYCLDLTTYILNISREVHDGHLGEKESKFLKYRRERKKSYKLFSRTENWNGQGDSRTLDLFHAATNLGFESKIGVHSVEGIPEMSTAIYVPANGMYPLQARSNQQRPG